MSEEEQRGQTYRAVCYLHPEVAFPVRADRLDAEEDKNTHIHRPGSHHVDVLTVDFLPADVEGFPEAGYARELGNQIQRAMQHLRDQPHHDEDGQASATN